MQVFADVIQVSRRILGQWIKRQQTNFRNVWISEDVLTWKIFLGIHCSVQVVYNAYQLAMYQIHTLVSPFISGATSPFQDLLRISIQPDIQSSCKPRGFHFWIIGQQVTDMIVHAIRLRIGWYWL